MPADDKVVVENINTPGKTSRVDRVKYEDMREHTWPFCRHRHLD